MNELYDLEHKAYISFSGGKDSTVLSKLFDLAIPENQIPRVYINTGIDYRAIIDFVKEYGKRDGRLQIIRPSQNIKQILETYGYPFKSKEHRRA
jgi:3'-phosphoadenosine 5'-phosphosulfate sulfotransferase (PAPS reductase)/FAD synthetase